MGVCLWTGVKGFVGEPGRLLPPDEAEKGPRGDEGDRGRPGLNGIRGLDGKPGMHVFVSVCVTYLGLKVIL